MDDAAARPPHPLQSAQTTEELFRSADLLVRKVAPYGGACCVVTFDSFTDHRTLERTGFGELFFNINKIDAFHVISRDNRWYHYPEMADAMAQIHAATRGYNRVMTYGSSMGAYAAIRFAELAGANAILALSPQYSIEPSVVPWEQRWATQGKHHDPRWEHGLPLPSIEEAYLIYDPIDRDGRHAAEYARRVRIQPATMPHAGHPVTGCLAEIGLLQELVIGTCRGDLDRARFWKVARERLPNSSQYLCSLVKHMPTWRRKRRIALLQRAMTLAPGDPAVYRGLAVELRKARRFDEAIAMHKQSLELLPGHPNLMLGYSFTLEAQGNIEGAIAVLEDIHQHAGGEPIYQYHLDAMRRRLVMTRGERLRHWGFHIIRRLSGTAPHDAGHSA